jgi:hypothetical protein
MPMVLSKALARLGGAFAIAALLLSVGLAFGQSAHAQAPMLLYGPAATASTAVVVLVDGSVCETAAVAAESSSSTGFLWVAQIDDGECSASTGSAISFSLDGVAASETATWSAGGSPANTAVGITLTTGSAAAAPAASPTPPDTGSAAMATTSSTSSLLVLVLGAMAIVTLAGARTATGRQQ